MLWIVVPSLCQTASPGPKPYTRSSRAVGTGEAWGHMLLLDCQTKNKLVQSQELSREALSLEAVAISRVAMPLA